jgi:PEP-CTERM motif
MSAASRESASVSNHFQTVSIGFGVSGGGVTGHLFYDFGDTAFSSVGTFHSEFDAGQSGELVVSIVPEPSTWAMMLLGFAGLGFAGYRVRRTAKIVATS